MAIVVSALETDVPAGGFDVGATVDMDGRRDRVVFRRHGDHPRLADRTDTFDPFAVLLLLPAMLRGEPLVVEGSIDEVLLASLRGPVQDTLRLLDRSWRRVEVRAEPQPAPPTAAARGAAGGMSAGIDSMHLVRNRLLDPDVPDALRLRTLLHHHVGAHGGDDAVFAERLGHARRVADRLGLPLVGASCAAETAYRGMPFIHCHTMRHVAASMTLDHLFSLVHYASSEELGRRPRRSRFSGISTIEAQLLPLFDTPRVAWRSFGGAATRLAKTADVIADDRLCGDLCVCIRGSRRDRAALNCGRCYKCARLLLQAEASGRLDAVAGTFDMAAWRAGRGHAVTRVLWLALGPQRTANEADLLAFLDDRGFPFPWWARPWVGIGRAVATARRRA
ncbi:MAG: hypothetical protein ACKOZU_06850 [Planctomycetaceae bacterium]